MRRRKAKPRQHKLIGFKAYTDTDADLLAWWESIEPGDRSDCLRELIRVALGYLPPPTNPADDLAAVRNDVAWMREALNDLPGYVEQVIQQVAAYAVVLPEARAPTAARNGPELSEQDASRREQHMKKAKW